MRIAKMGSITMDEDLNITIDGFEFVEVADESMELIVAFTLRTIADQILVQAAKTNFKPDSLVENRLPI